MKLFLLILFLTILGIKCEEKDFVCKTTGPLSTTKRLHEHLFCEYDTDVRPSFKKYNATVINFRLSPQYVEFDEQQNTLLFFTWLDVSWLDQHLTWEPEKWDNIRSIHVKSYDLWTPSLTVFNHGDMSEIETGISITDCLLTYNGTVKCVTPTKYTSHCPTNYDEWPYDKHNCSIHIGAWMFEYNEILFQFDDNAINMIAFRPNNQWHVHVSKKPRLQSYHEEHDEGEISVAITVFLQRYGSRLAIIYILPIVVLMILTLIVLWLDSQSLERILVACVNFICHILGLSDLHYYFPTKGSSTTPKIMIFYEASVGLAAFALIFTCLLRKLRSLNVSAPMWIASGTALVINSPVSPYLGIAVDNKREAGLLDEGEDDGETKASRDRTWQELATILECISFAVVFLTYVIMLGIVLPPSEPRDHSTNYWY